MKMESVVEKVVASLISAVFVGLFTFAVKFLNAAITIHLTTMTNFAQTLLSSAMDGLFIGVPLGLGYIHLKNKIQRHSYYIDAIAFVVDYRTTRLARNSGSYLGMYEITVGDREEKLQLKDMLESKFGDYLTANEIKRVMSICYPDA